MLDDPGQPIVGALPERRVFEAAASWYVQFQAEPPTAAQRLAWQRWLDSDPAHLLAWNHLENLQRNLGAMPGDLAQRALASPRRRRQVLKTLLILGGTGYLGWNLQSHSGLANVWADYRTRTGQRKGIDLADGSRIELNTATAIDVLFDDAQRLIRVREGEILVRTGKRGDTRPFFVETAEGRVQALGTRFSVRQLPSSTRVGVLEDSVSLQPADPAAQSRLLKAGERADFSAHGVGPSQAYRAAEVAWIEGQLIVLDAPLGEVIDELARYRPGVLQCEARAARLRVSGAFRLDASDLVLANLQATLPIRVDSFTRYWVSIKHRG
ncbi:FecR domain-containing protein [Pseudomonas sp. RIT-PI-AD]|uniref:FecR domain-containing protein n=1 Tax=Pseudomonas sp. RIT-PI-AD TaxID=3035294 RepID=UPI0021D974D9|nr:FecR domain-containing protein [Pseudomonas sp. RIT-PI-AD]